jgi:hypothetical protein
MDKSASDQDKVKPGQEMLFLNGFYHAHHEHLERLKLFGQVRVSSAYAKRLV